MSVGIGNGSKKQVSAKIRHEAIKLVLEQNKTIAEVAKLKGIGKSTLSKYLSDYKNNNNKIMMNDEDNTKPSISLLNTTPKQAELLDYKNQIKQLKAEKDILKKTIAILMAES